jgi:hypothetical protein
MSKAPFLVISVSNNGEKLPTTYIVGSVEPTGLFDSQLTEQAQPPNSFSQEETAAVVQHTNEQIAACENPVPGYDAVFGTYQLCGTGVIKSRV